MPKSTELYSVFECIGDPAKDIMATAVVASLKYAHPDRLIIVVTLHPEIWLHNPNVYRVYKIGAMSYFYDEYVKEKGTLIFRHDPYTTTDFVYGKKHLIDIWCDLCNVPRVHTMPSLYFTWREKEAVGKLTKSEKPTFYIQASGSLDQSLPYLWQKDIPLKVAEDVVAKMNAKGYQSIQIKDAYHPVIQGAAILEMSLRQKLCALSYSKKRLFIDSYLLQAATALNQPSVAFYVTGSPKVTGYAMHKNIEKKESEKLSKFIESYKEGYDIRGMFRTSPHPLDELFSTEKILEALKP